MDWQTASEPYDRNPMWARVGLWRVPLLTLSVLLVTVIANAAQVLDTGLLESWERSPQMSHGEWWRLGTALFVQDGGALGTIANLGFLLVLGTLCEQVFTRWEWSACYFGAGVIGEIAGHFWQPVGAGNSVAVCGIAGALVVVLWTDGPSLPAITPYAALYWAGALVGERWWLFLVAVFPATQVAKRLGVDVNRFGAAVSVVVALVLVAATDIHGAALLGGIAIGGLLHLLSRQRHGSRRPQPTTPPLG